jgi:protein SCO1/2
VVTVDQRQQTVAIAHEEIPGYMTAMTMPFTLKEKWAYNVLAAGDRVQATLVVTNRGSWLEEIVITKASAAAGHTDTATYLPVPNPGDQVPNFSLINQDAKGIQLQQYRGKVLFLTFIYTRCPLADFCPKLVGSFAELQQILQRDPTLSAKTHLLCVSFDPTFDTPTVLRSYGAAYASSNGSEAFSHWEFASGSPQQVQEVARFFGLVYEPQTNQIAHSLRTVVITPEGKVFKVYRDNRWTPADLVRDARQALAG